MERPGVSSCIPYFLFAVFVLLSSAAAQNELVYTAEKGEIRLKPETSGPFNNILWKHQGNLVVEWVGGQLDYYGKFKGPATLDTTTGGLVITNTDDSFAGLYTVETNSQVQAKGYEVVFIKEVTKPEVVVRPLACSHESTDCKLVCNDTETPAFGPLTYSWREDGGEWIPGDRERPIINDVKTKGIETFSCRVKNPISQAESDPHKNPFFQEPGGGSSAGKIVGGIVVAALVGAIAGVGVAWRKGKLTFLPENLQPSRGGMNVPANSNGNAGNQPTGEGEPLKTSPSEDTNKNPPTPNDNDPADPPTLTTVSTS